MKHIQFPLAEPTQLSPINLTGFDPHMPSKLPDDALIPDGDYDATVTDVDFRVYFLDDDDECRIGYPSILVTLLLHNGLSPITIQVEIYVSIETEWAMQELLLALGLPFPNYQDIKTWCGIIGMHCVINIGSVTGRDLDGTITTANVILGFR